MHNSSALALVVNNYITRQGIDKHVLSPARWLSRDWKNKLELGKGIAFFYGFRAMFRSHVIMNETGEAMDLKIYDYEGYNFRIESREAETGLSFTETHIDPISGSYTVDNDIIAVHTSEVSFKSEFPISLVPFAGYFNYLLLIPISYHQC